ncbi:MAG TPA: glutathione S-transferase C-terminal domain-containing protein [Myxococcota bacterium]|nr:glutathione S-transferase C-terminal domain-containing protein [Myxococcota bacterium]
MSNPALRIVGMPGSPYSRKLRAVLRYRRIPHRWVLQRSPEGRDLPQPKVQLLPQLVSASGPGGALEARIDSTPLLRELEYEYLGREIVPSDPAIAFLDALLEDYADEWLTKAMFHYRWSYEADIARAAAILPRWGQTAQTEEQARAMGELFSKRQIDRLWVVGSNETTRELIEASYLRLLALLDARLVESRFVMGGRPGASDFGLYGQLTQLVGFDPTPSALALELAPRVVAWVDFMEDLSGVEPEAEWFSRDALPATFRALLCEAGRVYAPFLLANAAALASGSDQVECTIDGQPWTQRPFPYQGKCLEWLRADHARLGPDDQRAVDESLAGTGLEALFAQSS